MFFQLTVPHSAQAQVRSIQGINGRGIPGTTGNASAGTVAAGNPNAPFANDSSHVDSTAAAGIVYNTETPDSLLRQKVFFFRHRPTRIWIDQVWNPTLDPTGIQFYDPLDAMWSFIGTVGETNYYLGKGSVGHPHIALFPTLADGLQARLQPDIYPGYAYTVQNISFFQTLTPFSILSYGNSLADDHSLQLLHTQNIMPGWNAAFHYRLLNPEGVYTSSGALNHYLDATTNYFSNDARLQASAAIVWQSFNIDENGGLSNDNIFINHLQSNRAGIPVQLSGSGSLQRNLAAMASVSYSLERQSVALRHRDSLALVQANDSTVRTDTIDVVDTIPLRQPRILNLGVMGLELNTDRQKRVFTDSTLWRERRATLFWTNDAYTLHRWRNPLAMTLGLQPRMLTAVICGDTARNASWLNPFARLQASMGRTSLTLAGESFQNQWSNQGADSRWSATLRIDLDSNATSFAVLSAVGQSKAPDWMAARYYMAQNGGTLPFNVTTERYSLQIKLRNFLNLNVGASHIGNHTWFDTSLVVHQGIDDFWLLQGKAILQLAAGPMHLDMQHFLQHSTDTLQMPVPRWATKNSLYADFMLFKGSLRTQVGIDVRYHTPYLAPLYDPTTGFFLCQDDIRVGGYLWGDVFVCIQVKRVSAYVKAGHINALWENPSRYFLLPHYPGQRFGLQWGLTWCFFD